MKKERLLDPVFLSWVTCVVGAVVWIYSTFAQIRYVEAKFDESVKHADANYARNRELLMEIRNVTLQIDSRLWELQNKNEKGKGK